MEYTSEQLTKAKAAKSIEELLALAKENGIELTEDKAQKYFAELHKEGEIADEELENAAGGGLCDPEPVIYTKMICDNCGANTFWTGDYVNGIAYKCPMCSVEAYFGKWTTDYTGW